MTTKAYPINILLPHMDKVINNKWLHVICVTRHVPLQEQIIKMLLTSPMTLGHAVMMHESKFARYESFAWKSVVLSFITSLALILLFTESDLKA